MRQRELDLHEDDLREQLLPLLRGRVFHVTSAERFKAIVESRFIRATVDGSLGNTYPQSVTSLGRQKGWVCLFDLRDKTESAIDQGLDCFYFLAPRPLGDRVAFLIIVPEVYCQLVTSHAIAESDLGATRIPNLECWFPGDLPVECVDEALIVTVSRRLVTAHLEAVLEAHRRSKKRIDPH